MLVVPRGVAPWRRYALSTIVLALAGFGAGESAPSLRARLSPEQTFEAGWPSLRRWIRAVAEGKLFRWVRGVSELSGRVLAQRVAAVAAEASGSAERGAPLEARAWSGVMASSSW
jgi:hypothetical protein